MCQVWYIYNKIFKFIFWGVYSLTIMNVNFSYEEGTEGELVNIDAEDEGKNYKVNIFIDWCYY